MMTHILFYNYLMECTATAITASKLNMLFQFGRFNLNIIEMDLTNIIL
jgi:hypothetical protein